MPDTPATLYELAEMEIAAAEADITEAQSALAAAQERDREAKQESAELAETLLSLQADLATATADLQEAIRAALTSGSTSDIDALNDVIAGLLLEIRENQELMVRARRDMLAAQAEVARTTRTLERAKQRSTAAEKTLAGQEAGAERMQDATEQIASSTYAQLHDDASALHDEVEEIITAAIADVIPADLLQAAQKRRDLEKKKRSVAHELETYATSSLDSEQSALDEASALLNAFLQNGPRQYDDAVDFVASEMPELSEEQEAELVTLEEDGKPAAELEIELSTKEIALEEERMKLEKARIDQVLDPTVDLTTRESDYASALTERNNAAAAYLDEAGAHDALKLWERAVPDELWRYIFRAHEHLDALATIKTTAGSVLLQNVTDAEKALAERLWDSSLTERRRRDVEDELLELALLARAANEDASNRGFAILRGELVAPEREVSA